MAQFLEEYVDGVVNVIMNDGRNIVGILRGFDQMTNIILEKCHERIYSLDQGVEKVPLGLYIVRGDNVAIIGELLEDEDANVDLENLKGEPLKPLKH